MTCSESLWNLLKNFKNPYVVVKMHSFSYTSVQVLPFIVEEDRSAHKLNKFLNTTKRSSNGENYAVRSRSPRCVQSTQNPRLLARISIRGTSKGHKDSRIAVSYRSFRGKRNVCRETVTEYSTPHSPSTFWRDILLFPYHNR